MKKIILIFSCIMALTACSSHRVSQFPSYKLTIEQGNELDEKTLSQLQEGLTRNQVASLLGTPLLKDIFHADRWDYVFLVSRNGITKEQATLSVFFEDDAVSSIKGNALDYIKSQDGLAKNKQTKKIKEKEKKQEEKNNQS